MLLEMVNDTKELDPEAVRKSVQDLPKPTGFPPGLSNSTFFLALNQAVDEITPWGRNIKVRDRELREFITTEPIFASALSIVCSRNSAFRWKIEGPEIEVRKFQKILRNANFGRGWVDLMMKVSIDLYTQDNGAFIEVVREGPSEGDEIIALNHLDSARCFHTGAPEAPVIYMDRKGQYHLMRWWQVIPLADMPCGIEGFYGLQYCALTRMLRAAQVIKNISIYDYERTGGRHTRAIHLLKGVTAGQVQEAIDEMTVRLNAKGMQRYSQPLMVGSVDPKADVGHDTLELASLPDNLDRETAFKWYLSQIAMAFMEDYQTFAPLPGGNLGSSQQSEVLNAKARGKGPALFQQIMTHALNDMIFPEDVEFMFDEQDIGQAKEEASLRQIRATERSVRISSGEITPGAARQIALDAGDLTEELFEALGGDDVTADVMLDSQAGAEAQVGEPGPPRVKPLSDLQEPKPTVQPGKGANPSTEVPPTRTR